MTSVPLPGDPVDTTLPAQIGDGADARRGGA